jgi:Zn-dependent metalloprotease
MSPLAKALSLAILMGTVGQAAAADTGGALDRALAAIRQNPGATRLSSFDNFSVRGVTVDRNGTEHVRLDRTYKGLPVIGGDLVVHSRAGAFKSASLTQVKPLTLSVTPTLTSAQAITNAGVQFGTNFDAVPTARLVVYARTATPKLAYNVLYSGQAKDKTPILMHYYVDAATGAILNKENDIETGTLPGTGGATGTPPPPSNVTPAIGQGNSLYAGVVTLNTQWNATRRVYELTDSTRGNTHINDIGNGYRGAGTLVVDADNKWGNGATSDRVSAAVDAAHGFALTWDFYKTAFNRIGIAGDGVGAYGAVHYSINYNNAFWSNACFCMSFGDGDGVNLHPLVAIDVMGHEVSHGVTAATAQLAYSSETGGLNEANSDIMGTMVEYSANSAQQPGNYIIGDTLFINPDPTRKAIRWMFKPHLDGTSPDCYPSATNPSNGITLPNFQAMDVHYSSGVANHFYYLLAEGAVVPAGFGAGTAANLGPSDLVCNGSTGIAGIGRAKAQQIWYRALTVYMTSNTNYAGARVATMNAAADLYGAGSAEQNAVAAAWNAVYMP